MFNEILGLGDRSRSSVLRSSLTLQDAPGSILEGRQGKSSTNPLEVSWRLPGAFNRIHGNGGHGS